MAKDITQTQKKNFDKLASNNVLCEFSREMHKLQRFEVGDIVHYEGDYDYVMYGNIEFKNYAPYKDGQYQSTDIRRRYKVVYVDSEGFPVISSINEDGNLGNAFSILDYMSDMVGDFVSSDDWEPGFVDRLIEHDQEYVNSTILETDYDPLHELKRYRENENDSIKEKVEQFYELDAHNKKLRVYTGSPKARDKFYNNTEVGSKYWDKKRGSIEITMKDQNIIVTRRDINGELEAIKKSDLGKLFLYSKEPEQLPHVTTEQKEKYKPNKK